MPHSFHPAVAAWFAGQFPAPTPAQARAWPLIRAQRNVLIAAPTGSGKTLAAFLAAIDALVVEGLATGLADDDIRRRVRTGDTPQHERASMRRRPPHIVVTTPESLYVLLGSESGRTMLSTTRTVIVDEIHALASNKRGSHLALSLARLDALVERQLTRIGLSATQKPIEDVARFLVGGAAAQPQASGDPVPTCAIVDAGHVRPRD